MDPLITIFTPTYNRAYLLHKLYDSLNRQSSKNFEWVIVDDGSTDNTKELIEGWRELADFKINYYLQQNAGKMAAHNRGVEMAEGELFLCVDSDDYISDNCIEILEKEWPVCSGQSNVGGIIAYKKLLNKEQFEFPEGDYKSIYQLYEEGFSGDTTIVMRTEVFREYPFPILKGEKFITEGYVYDQISQTYVMHFLRDYLTICEYMPDGYSQNATSLYKRYPGGWALYRKQRYVLDNGFKRTLKNMAEYISFSRQYGKKFCDIVKDAPNKFMCIICYPIGIYQDIKYRKVYYKDVA